MSISNKGALDNHRYRVIVSTDIGGSDPDDFQSMVHYLLYADMFDTEGLISSPWDKGTSKDILTVIDHYEKDYPNLVQHSKSYPKPDDLRSITKQGTLDIAPFKGYSKPSQGSKWIIECANKVDDRPLYILAWGLLEDLAQALHDDPSIVDKLRVYYIGGPNKKWGLNAYEYINKNHSDLWIIENNSTYRGWFVGGHQSGNYGNTSFVSEHLSGSGALGDFFSGQLGGCIKMGDTPSVAYLLKGTPEHPEKPSWGGEFVKVYNRPKTIYTRNTSLEDEVEVFQVMEFCFEGPNTLELTDKPVFSLCISEQEFDGFYCGNGHYRVRFMPKTTGQWSYYIKSDISELHNQSGKFTCTKETQKGRIGNKDKYPNWWSDRLDDDYSEGPHKGGKTVNQWRKEFLDDFADRVKRCK